MKNRDFLTLQDYSADEIWEILKLTKEIRNDPRGYSGRLSGKSVLLLFQKASTRTRVSFELAVRQLGGSPISLGWAESQLGRGETIGDTARVLSRYVQCVVARVYHHADLMEMARYADIPIVNALSDLYHPCQIVGDLFTIWMHFGSLEGLKLAYIGDGNNVCNSLLIGCSKMGLNIAVACPKRYQPEEEILKTALENAEESGSSVEVLVDPLEAAKNADVIYTDVFVSMGFEEERSERLKAFLPKYRVTADLFKHASNNAVFMHCLPAHRGEEVTDEVMDGP
ncbi:MAG: ornithine carbamoyltransferase, partial [Candidatus Bathyarchaeia archaeon]